MFATFDWIPETQLLNYSFKVERGNSLGPLRTLLLINTWYSTDVLSTKYTQFFPLISKTIFEFNMKVLIFRSHLPNIFLLQSEISLN